MRMSAREMPRREAEVEQNANHTLIHIIIHWDRAAWLCGCTSDEKVHVKRSDMDSELKPRDNSTQT